MLVLAFLTQGVSILSLCTPHSSSSARIAVLLVMRVYALYYRNKWILSVVMLEIAAGLLVACVSAARDDSEMLVCMSTCSGVSFDLDGIEWVTKAQSKSPHPPAFRDLASVQLSTR
jgi:hypothetical protein